MIQPATLPKTNHDQQLAMVDDSSSQKLQGPRPASGNHDVLAAQFSIAVSKRQAMIASWLGSDNDNDEEEEEAAASSAQFQILPSSSVGLGSKRSKLDRQQLQVVNNRAQYINNGTKTGKSGEDLKNLLNSAKALNSLKQKTAKTAAQRGGSTAALAAGPSAGSGGGADSDDSSEEETSRSKKAKRSNTASFFDAYRGQKKRKKF